MFIGISYVNVCLISLSGLMIASHHVQIYSWIIYNTECCVILLTSDLRYTLCIDLNYNNATKSCGFYKIKICKKYFFKNDQKHAPIENLTMIQPTHICNSSTTNTLLLLNSVFNYLILIWMRTSVFICCKHIIIRKQFLFCK